MTPERYTRIGELYHQVLARPVEQREAFLAEACEGDDTLREEVVSLLAAHDAAASFIETPAIAAAAASLAIDYRPIAPGARIGPYEVRALLGRGGMGEVYRAHDPRLGRDVALKVLPERFAPDAPRLARFEREARLLAALNHANIGALYGVEDSHGQWVLVLELATGPTLAERLSAGSIPVRETLAIAAQILEALDAAHEHGIIHRDLKPANITIRPDGTVKVLDFGLAKALDAPPGGQATLDVAAFTDDHTVVGTIPYMSPEQARGANVDQRTDIWAFGCVLYEMLTGRRAFAGQTFSDCIVAILEREPDWSALPSECPPVLERLLRSCLAKDCNDRLRHIREVRVDLRDTLDALTQNGSSASRLVPSVSRTIMGRFGNYLTLAAAVGGLAAGLYFWNRDRDARWLAREVVPQIERYLDVADWESAYALAKQADARVPNSAEIAELWPRLSWRVTIPSAPAGAIVYRQAFDARDDQWEELGRTPLENIRFPYGLSRLRFELEGHRPVVRALGGAHVNWQELRGGNPLLDTLLVGPDIFTLDTPETLPADMVRVPGGSVDVGGAPLQLRDFFIGRYEVTNAEYKAFVDADGYQMPALWEPVVVNGKTIPWDRAMRLFVDQTGRPGPSTWQASDYREGEGELPVSGVSWYEAAAYARFVGRELPTAHHWQQAVANAMFPWLLPVSNFNGSGPWRVTGSRAMSHVGAYDMTGNVREWTASTLADERIILGGSWNEAYYIAGVRDTSASPLDRSASNGFRLAITHDDPAVARQARIPLQSRTTVSPVLRQQPVSDDVYRAYSRIFDYDRRPLNAAIEATHATRVWVRHRILLDAAYGAEQMLLHLYLPARGSAPYQTIVYWPGWDTFGLDDVDEYFAKQLDFVVKSGRAVAFPIYKGTFERRVGNARVRPDFDTAAYRDNTIDTVKDLRRTIDYLEARQDIDMNTLAFFGYSWGGVNGPTALAQEPRLRSGVIQIGLLPPMHTIPEVDPVNALPRVRVPVLLFSSEFDPMVPLANARRYFELLGSAPAEKRHVLAIGGHFIPRELVIRETLTWFDMRMGPMSRQ